MVDKNNIYEIIREKDYLPMTDMEIAQALGIENKEMGTFIAMFDEMEKMGEVYKTRKNKYIAPERVNLIPGKLRMNVKGFGFVMHEVDLEGDIYISPMELNGAMNDDRVIVRLLHVDEEKKKREGEVIKVTERANYEVVGTFDKSRNFAFVVPDDKKIRNDIFVSRKDFKGAQTGDKVIVKLTKWPEQRRNPEGKIIEVLGNKNDVGVDILSVIKKYKFAETFPIKVMEATEQLNSEVKKDEFSSRVDLRDEQTITIDGKDARDLDDAVSIKMTGNQTYILKVSIADVTHYVKENSPLDKEALNRGTSVYFVDRVIPMLPPKLSNGICSLNPNEDRLTLTIEMEVNQQGKIIKHEIYEAIINSKERMNYTDVSDILELKNAELMEKYKHILVDLKLMESLAAILRKKREARGSIDFNFDEAKVIIDEKGIPIEVKKLERRTANRLIEEFMLAANETIAEHFAWMNVPFLYRVHEEPNMEKIDAFRKFISNLGYTLKGNKDEIHPKALQELTKQVEGKKEERIINTIMLRSLKKAAYSEDNLGHFGLSAEYYTHFTSPIRRYPDLQIHRIIKEIINGKLTDSRIKKLTALMETVSKKTSETEKIAAEAEREVEDLKIAEFMSHHIGEEYPGIVSGVMSFGIFIELENTIEGLVKISLMDDDYYIYDESNYRLIGERTKKIYKIGDEVNIKVIGVNIPLGEIDFLII